jgi:hypothetical protein
MIARLGGAEDASRLEVLCERRISESVVALMRGREAMVCGVILRMVWGRSKLRRRGRWLLKWWVFFFFQDGGVVVANGIFWWGQDRCQERDSFQERALFSRHVLLLVLR